MHVRCRAGLGYLTEERSVIMNLTRSRQPAARRRVTRSRRCELFPELGPLLKRTAGLLSGGEQQMLALARALGREPKVLLADELSLGLAPLVVTRLLATLRAAADERGVGILLVEQHVRQALAIADRVYVMDRGTITLSGPVERDGAAASTRSRRPTSLRLSPDRPFLPGGEDSDQSCSRCFSSMSLNPSTVFLTSRCRTTPPPPRARTARPAGSQPAGAG